MSFELQQRLWTERLATTLALNAEIKDKRLHHPVLTFPEFIDSSEFHRYHDVKRWSFVDEKHYNFKEYELETFDEFYKRK